MHRRALLAALAVLIPAASAQDSFREWTQSRKQEFQSFREKRDREFHQFLKTQWKAFRVYKGEVEDPAPKPKEIPRAPSAPEEPAPAPKPEPVPGPRAEPEPRPAPSPEPAPAPTPPRRAKGEPVAVAFLGHRLEIRVPSEWPELRVRRADKEGVAGYWGRFARTEVQPVVDQLVAARERLHLNGWGYLKLAESLSRSLYGEGSTATALTWGLLLKAGYDARIGYHDGQLDLLYRPRERLFDTPYFDLDGKRYYVYGADSGQVPRLYTYEADYAGADGGLEVALARSPRTGGELRWKVLSFDYGGESYRLRVPVDRELLGYLRSVPQLPLASYFGAQPDAGLEEALVGPLRKATADMGRSEQVNFLLRFVQTAFDYQTDGEQFGREDYLYPAETVFYPASDCEDRSVLFAWLARRVLGLEVAVLDYPGHVATALDLGASGKGVSVKVGGRSLVVADPTYINARVGMAMPEFRDSSPQVIPLWGRGAS